MAIKTVRIGQLEDAFLYDDEDYDGGIEVATIKLTGAGTDPDHALKHSDIPNLSALSNITESLTGDPLWKDLPWLGNVFVGDLSPDNPQDGQLWLDTSEDYPVLQVTSEKTATYTAANTDGHLICDGTFTLTLQPSADRQGILKVTNAGTGVITIEGNGSETINGSLNITLEDQYSTVDLSPFTGGYVI